MARNMLKNYSRFELLELIYSMRKENLELKERCVCCLRAWQRYCLCIQYCRHRSGSCPPPSPSASTPHRSARATPWGRYPVSHSDWNWRRKSCASPPSSCTAARRWFCWRSCCWDSTSRPQWRKYCSPAKWRCRRRTSWCAGSPSSSTAVLFARCCRYCRRCR